MVGEGVVGKEIADPPRHDGGIGRRRVAQGRYLVLHAVGLPEDLLDGRPEHLGDGEGGFHAGHMAAGLDRADQGPGELAGEGKLRLRQTERLATIRNRISHISDSTSVLTDLVNVLDIAQ